MREDFVRFGSPNTLQKESLIYSDGMGFESRTTFYVERTDFNNYLIMYTVSGELLCSQNGVEVAVKPGEAVLVDLHQPHKYHFRAGVPSKIAWAHMNGKPAVTIMEQIQKHQKLPMKLELPNMYERFVELFEATDRPVQDYFKQSECCYAMLMMFFKEAWQSSEENTEDYRYQEFKSKIWHKIEHGFHSNISLDELADSVSLSKYHFLRTFQKAFGVTPMQFITEEKIRQAKYRLLNTTDTISDISELLGFSTAGYFTKVFKKETGMTPSEYREKSNILPYN